MAEPPRIIRALRAYSVLCGEGVKHRGDESTWQRWYIPSLGGKTPGGYFDYLLATLGIEEEEGERAFLVTVEGAVFYLDTDSTVLREFSAEDVEKALATSPRPPG